MGVVGGGKVRVISVALYVFDCDGFSEVFELEQGNAELTNLFRGLFELHKDK